MWLLWVSGSFENLWMYSWGTLWNNELLLAPLRKSKFKLTCWTLHFVLKSVSLAASWRTSSNPRHIARIGNTSPCWLIWNGEGNIDDFRLGNFPNIQRKQSHLFPISLYTYSTKTAEIITVQMLVVPELWKALDAGMYLGTKIDLIPEFFRCFALVYNNLIWCLKNSYRIAILLQLYNYNVYQILVLFTYFFSQRKNMSAYISIPVAAVKVHPSPREYNPIDMG